MDFKIRIFKYLGGLKLIIVLLLKSIDTLFSILSIALVYPVTNYLQNREEFYKQINSLNLFKNFNLDSVIIFLFITFSYIIIRILYGQFFILYFSKFIVNLRFYWLKTLLKFYTSKNIFQRIESKNGVIISDWYADTNNSSRFVEGLINIYSIFIYIGVFFSYVYFFSPSLFIYVFISVTIFIVFWILKSKQNLIKKSSDKLKHQQNLLEEMDSIIQNRRDIIIYNIFNLASKKLKKVISNFSDSLIYNKIKSSKTNLYSEIIILSILGFIILFFYKSQLSLDSENTSGLVLLLALGLRTINYTNQVINKLIKVSLEYKSFNFLFKKLLDIDNKLENKLVEKIEIDSILIKDINFYLGERQLFKIEKIILKKGSYYQIVGPSGSGKSTFLDILTGFIKLEKGNIFIVNKNGEHKNNTEYYSYVSQKIGIYGANLIEIICGVNKFENKKFDLIKKICFLDNFDDEINDSNLSGGERARMGIARALYYDRPILILDESLSSVEFDLEIKILDKIKEFFPDIILIQVIHERVVNTKINGKIIFKENKTVILEET